MDALPGLGRVEGRGGVGPEATAGAKSVGDDDDLREFVGGDDRTTDMEPPHDRNGRGGR